MHHDFDPKQRRLGRHPLFRGLPRQRLRRLATLLDTTEVPAGTVLVRAGELPYWILIVADGAAVVPPRGAHPANETVIGLREAVDRVRHTTTVMTIAPTELYVAATRELTTLLELVPALAAASEAVTPAGGHHTSVGGPLDDPRHLDAA